MFYLTLFLAIVIFAAFIYGRFYTDLKVRSGFFLSRIDFFEKRRPSIAIVSLLNGSLSTAKYKTALNSVKCYALQNDYEFILKSDEGYEGLCRQRDFFFKRHCIVANILESHDFEWILFTDTDIGVVNEKIRIEKYIKDDAHIIFYDRIFNFEIMAGSYLAKKSNFSITFLRGWANYEKKIPPRFSGSDNGAIHVRISLVVEKTKRIHFAKALKIQTNRSIYVYKKGMGWARDAWLTNSHWSLERDFMFHALKEKDRRNFTMADKSVFSRRLSNGDYFPWINTLRTPLDMEKCRKSKA
ncbi:unnamed protein product [Heligmosomoides polygyrus]|uniref:Nucleotide-diphospho-sugar transferase domain-containing protein n=1 Tax=Heligmosomoides polygyrus TaxID=6339 RepID=A0A3P7ZRM8_HELPZ|nr:unnamed protein product [Heligmosomoides polygyrus]